MLEHVEDVLDELRRAAEHEWMQNRPRHARHISLDDPDGDSIGSISVSAIQDALIEFEQFKAREQAKEAAKDRERRLSAFRVDL